MKDRDNSRITITVEAPNFSMMKQELKKLFIEIDKARCFAEFPHGPVGYSAGGGIVVRWNVEQEHPIQLHIKNLRDEADVLERDLKSKLENPDAI